jgi:hypothetical protein
MPFRKFSFPKYTLYIQTVLALSKNFLKIKVFNKKIGEIRSAHEENQKSGHAI